MSIKCEICVSALPVWDTNWKPPTVKQIAREAEKFLGIGAGRLFLKTKEMDIVRPRWFVMRYICTKYEGYYRQVDIAWALGRTSHSTLIHGLKSLTELFEKDPMYRDQYCALFDHLSHIY